MWAEPTMAQEDQLAMENLVVGVRAVAPPPHIIEENTVEDHYEKQPIRRQFAEFLVTILKHTTHTVLYIYIRSHKERTFGFKAWIG